MPAFAKKSLLARIESSACQERGVTFVLGDEADQVSWSQLHEEAKGYASVLQDRGIRPGDHIGLLSPTTRQLVTAIQATWLCGATLVVLPLPMRLASIEEFVDQTRQRIRGADAKLVLIDPELAAFVSPSAVPVDEGQPRAWPERPDRAGDTSPSAVPVDEGQPRAWPERPDRAGGTSPSATPVDPPMIQLPELAGGDPSAWRRPADNRERLDILQFTSGSTSDPKGVMLPDKTLCANLNGLTEAGRLDFNDDVLVSWLPLYHDMGLVGLLTLPMSTGTELVLGAPQDFTARPSRWMEWVSAYGGTATAGPNFAYVLATRALKRGPELDLSRLRIALNGAEPVDDRNVREFVDAGKRHGLRPEAVFPAFGMAEVAIGGTFPEPLTGLRTDCVDRRVLETERYAAPAPSESEGSRRFARLGKPLPGLEIRVVDPERGVELKDREVGELEIRGTSVTPGYYKRADANRDLFHEGWLRTGDLAYILEGELVVCGRIKDVIIVGGRNVFPEDVERAVGGVEGVRAGNVIAFGIDGARGKESLVVVAETRAEVDELGDLRHRIAEKVVATVGMPAKEIVLVSPGALPKTSSGKLQRSFCKRCYAEGTLDPVGV